MSMSRALISTLDKVGQLPVGTRVPFAIWHNYLIILLDYLHGLMSNEEDAYALMHKHYALDHEPTLTKEDAADFVHVHFPDEGPLLKQPTDHLALLHRATTFALSRKYKAEVYARCSVKWAVLLYYIVNNKYPPISLRGSIDIEHCVQAIASIPAHRDRLALEIGRLFHCHPSLVSAMIQDHSLVFRLYGNSDSGHPKINGRRSRLHIFLDVT